MITVPEAPNSAVSPVLDWPAIRSETVFRTLADGNVSARQAFAYRIASPLAKNMIAKSLGVDDARRDRAITKVRAQVTAMEERLARTSCLAGDSFTAADLTFAALLAPVLLVTREEGYGATLPRAEELSREAQDLVAEVRASRAGKFAIETYRRHRQFSRR